MKKVTICVVGVVAAVLSFSLIGTYVFGFEGETWETTCFLFGLIAGAVGTTAAMA